MRKILPIFVIGVLLLSGLGAGALALADENESISSSERATHTVIGELGTATWCGYCQYAHGALKELFSEGQLDFYYVSLVSDKNGKASQRCSELGLTGYPTLFWDGKYRTDVGAGSIPSAKATYTGSISACGNRIVEDIDIDLVVTWLGGTEMKIDVSVDNNEASTYDGRIRVYITEIVSSRGWYDTGGHLYTYTFLDWAFNEDISITAGGSWDDYITWDGSSNGFPTITEDNIMIIAAVFNSNSGFVDETSARAPGGGGGAPDPPEAPDGPTEGVIDVEYSFSAITEDPQGDNVSYLFDWGDGTDSGWLGPYPSGTEQSASHSWDNEGDYDIKVKAKDENGAESDWSNEHTIEIFEGSAVEIVDIIGGFTKVSSTIRNPGTETAENINWQITLDGGLILLGKDTTGEISIPAGGEEIVNSKLILGFGKTRVIVTAEIPDGDSDTKNQGAKVILFFIRVNPGG
jgi:hypothetical protein